MSDLASMIYIKEFKNRIRSSKEGKTVFANLGYLTLLQVAGYVFPLITMPYLARVIGADGFGKIAFATAVVVWFQTVADWGFNLTATRDVAQNRYDKNVVSRIFSNVLNPFTFTSYEGFDPEWADAQVGDGTGGVSSRTYQVGINLKF